MSIRTINRTPWYGLLGALLILTVAGTGQADAQYHGGGGQQFHGGLGGPGHGPSHAAPPANQHFDGRYAHNQFYFNRGYVVHSAPVNGFAVQHGPQHFWYDHGQWYRRSGSSFVVVAAPIGVFVPVLPPFYTTIWFHGLPYYYANDTYYTWDDAQQGYEVVAPPDDIDSTGSAQAPANNSIFIYPKNGQSAEQQDRDRYECYRAAVDQTGYDVTQPGGGVPRELAVAKRADYFRAQAACLDARGYSVK